MIKGDVTRNPLFLLAAIVLEVIATTALARSQGFTRIVPGVVALLGYAGAFWFLSHPLRVMPTGVVYAIWSGLGIVLIALVAWLWSRQPLDLPAILGMGLIMMVGVVVIKPAVAVYPALAKRKGRPKAPIPVI
jgi:small multidrug resistance pump